MLNVILKLLIARIREHMVAIFMILFASLTFSYQLLYPFVDTSSAISVGELRLNFIFNGFCNCARLIMLVFSVFRHCFELGLIIQVTAQ
jgi:hypothetical protein